MTDCSLARVAAREVEREEKRKSKKREEGKRKNKKKKREREREGSERIRVRWSVRCVPLFLLRPGSLLVSFRGASIPDSGRPPPELGAILPR